MMPALLVLALLLQSGLQLFERDAESWAGHTYGERLQLDERAELRTVVGQRQRLNPAVYSDRYLSNVGIWLALPAGLQAEASDVWIVQSRNAWGEARAARISQINAGERINTRQALYLTAARPGVYPVEVIITARELRQPVLRRFAIEAR